MTREPDLFSRMAVALEEMGRSLGQEIDGAVSRTVQSLGQGGRRQTADDFTAEEELVLDRVEEYLARGLALDRWWQGVSTADSFTDRFELGRTFNDADRSFGFFDHVSVGGRNLPVMGNFQEMLYDQPKSPRDGRTDAALWMRDQIRQFVLRYFMRVSDFCQPEGYTGAVRPAPACLGPLSWCPRDEASRQGFGFQQLFYKKRSGEIGRFPAEERFAIVDLRQIGPVYEWIVAKVRIFDFNFAFKPFGSGNPQLVVPLQEDSYLVLTRDFVRDEAEPAPHLLGRYGLGYAFLKNPRQGALAYGPGEFEAAIERIDFEVHRSGQVRVAMTFVANRPERLVNVSLDPLALGVRMADLASLGLASRLLGGLPSILAPRLEADPVYAYVDLANLLTGGAAARDLCISRDQLDRDFLVKHFIQHYQAVAGSLATWRRVCDWLDEASLPVWARLGRSAG